MYTYNIILKGIKMNELLEKIYNDKEFINVIDDMINNKTVQEMKKYRQHYET